MKTRYYGYLAVPAALLASPSFAAIDVSAITSKISEGDAAAASIGIAILTVLGAIAVWKALRRAT